MAKRSRLIPANLFKDRQIYRNLIEGIIESFILFVLVSFVPFTKTVRWVVVLSLMAFIMLINAMGIQGNSLIQTFKAKRKYKRLVKHTFSFRRFKDGIKRDHTEIIKNNKVLNIRRNRGIKFIQSLMDR